MTKDQHEELRFYEEQWLKANENFNAERQQRLELEDELYRLKVENEDLRGRAEAVLEQRLLQDEIESLRTQLSTTHGRLGALAHLEDLERELAARQKTLERLQRRFAREDFWRGLASEFAESLDSFPAIYGSAETDPDQLALDTMRQWHAQLEASLQAALTGRANAETVEHSRKLLIAEWVLLRWLEVAEVVQ